MSFNGQRVIISASQTTTTSSTAAAPVNVPNGYTGCILHLHVSAASGTSPTLNVYIQDTLLPAASGDLLLGAPSTTYANAVFDDFASFTQMTGTGDAVLRIWNGGTSAGNAVASGSLSAATVRVGPIGNLWMVKWVLTATTPSFTWSVVANFFDI